MIWYFDDQARFREERRTIEELLARADWLSPADGWAIGDGARITWNGDITIDGQVWPLSLRYPQHFPHSPPLVLPRGDTTRWSAHQWGPGGELCLEYGPDNWHLDLTGADMLESAHRLLRGEQPRDDGERGVVASRHSVTLGQAIRTGYLYLFVTREFEEAAKGVPEGALLTAVAFGFFHAESYIYIVSSFTGADGQVWTQPDIPAPIKFEEWERPAALFRLALDAKLPTTSLADFMASLAAAGLTLPDVTCAIALQGSDVQGYHLNAKGGSVRRCTLIPPQPQVERLDPGHKALAARRVAVVGCGSLGSKIAVMLARASVDQFLLVDDDLLFPDNLVRHDLDWREIGTHKVDSVARRIKLVNPHADVSVRRHKLGGQEASGSVESLIEELAKCDLMIDATADPKVFNYLCAAVHAGQKPMMWAEVFGGGIGGLIARHRPGIEPAPATMRGIIESWCVDRGKPAGRPAGRYGNEGGSGTAMIADDADVTVIAAHAARMAIDLMIPRAPSAFPHSAYMIGLLQGQFFSQPFDTQPIEIGGAEPPATLPQEETFTEEDREFFAELVQKFAYENSSDRQDSSAS
jgi:hypothetical protein